MEKTYTIKLWLGGGWRGGGGRWYKHLSSFWDRSEDCWERDKLIPYGGRVGGWYNYLCQTWYRSEDCSKRATGGQAWRCHLCFAIGCSMRTRLLWFPGIDKISNFHFDLNPASPGSKVGVEEWGDQVEAFAARSTPSALSYLKVYHLKVYHLKVNPPSHIWKFTWLKFTLRPVISESLPSESYNPLRPVISESLPLWKFTIWKLLSESYFISSLSSTIR